jgi:hypothetical protein
MGKLWWSLAVMIFLWGGQCAAAEDVCRDCSVTTKVTIESSFGAEGQVPVARVLTVKAGDFIEVELLAAGGTGYEWKQMNENISLARLVSTEGPSPVEAKAGLVGGKERLVQIWQISDHATSGTEVLQYRLVRGWEKGVQPARSVDITLQVE